MVTPRARHGGKAATGGARSPRVAETIAEARMARTVPASETSGISRNRLPQARRATAHLSYQEGRTRPLTRRNVRPPATVAACLLSLPNGGGGHGRSQLAHRGAFSEVRDAAGAFRVLNPPFRFSAAPTGAQSHAPALGEHGDEVLTEVGYTLNEIEAFRKSRVLG